MLLEKLSEINSVSGNEKEIRKFIIEEIKPYVDDVRIDKIGNVIAYKSGKNKDSKIMISAPMDEVGLMVNSIGAEGLLGFTLVGDIDSRILISKPVFVGDARIKGVIGAKPIHLQKSDERKRSLDYDQLYIDIGTSSKEETEKLVSIGDYVSFKSKCIKFGDNLLKGKALDNRSGCSTLINLVKENSGRSFYAVFSVMREIGIFGGYPATYSIKPDINIILGSSLGENKLGKGPILSFMEEGAYLDKELTKSLVKIANDKNIPYQLSGFDSDKSDVNKMQTSASGSKTIKVSIPCNYRRSPVTVINKEDLKNTKLILQELLNEIGGN